MIRTIAQRYNPRVVRPELTSTAGVVTWLVDSVVETQRGILRSSTALTDFRDLHTADRKPEKSHVTRFLNGE